MIDPGNGERRPLSADVAAAKKKAVPSGKEFRSMGLLLLTAIIWGLAFVAQRAGMDYVGAFTFNAVRFLLGALSLMVVIFVLECAGKRGRAALILDGYTFRAGLVVGLFLFAAAALQQIGVQITMSAGKSGFITGLYIVITPVIGRLLGRRTGLPTWIGAVLACAGLYLLSAPEGLGSVGVGDIALLVCAFFWAIHILVVDHFVAKADPLRLSVMQFLVCAVLSFVCAAFFEEMRFSAIVAGRTPLLYSGLLSVGVAYTLQIVGQRHVQPAKAALIFSMESLFAAVGAALLLSERMSCRAYTGCALIFAGIIASQALPLLKKILPKRE